MVHSVKIDRFSLGVLDLEVLLCTIGYEHVVLVIQSPLCIV